MTYDAIVVGGGHNGLTTAAYLGKAGLRVLVLERRAILGGAAVTEEFHPGYRNSIASYTVSLLRPEVIADLELERHGYETIAHKGALYMFSEGEPMLLTGDETHDRMVYGRHSNRDYDATVHFYKTVARVGEVLRAQWLKEPPPLGGGALDLTRLLPAGRAFRKLSAEDRHFLMQLFTSSATSLAERWFESERVRNEFLGHCVSSNFASLEAPGSAVPLFQNALGEFQGRRGSWGLAKGGMGAITQAMARSGAEYGVEFRCEAPVARILIESGQSIGVRIENGEEIHSRIVVANTDPKRTFLKMVGREHLPDHFADDIAHLRYGHASLRMNLALAGAPEFAGLNAEENMIARASALYIYPSRAEIQAGYRAACDGDIHEAPYVNMLIPSSQDHSLAPQGHHVMSLLCKYFPYRLADGRDWKQIKERVADAVVRRVARHIPNLPDLIVARQVLSPLDLEEVFGLTEGDIFHGRHDLDQIFSLRPHPDSAQYRTPIGNLYLCGSGTHPGGGVSGAPGRNAAMRIIADLGVQRTVGWKRLRGVKLSRRRARSKPDGA
jgi:phytoene dehydrogenase-like protein